MSRANSGYLRTLERLEKAAQEYLDRVPEVPVPAKPTREAAAPSILQRVADQLSRIEETLSRAGVNAAGVENLLQTEADVFAAWAESLGKVANQLRTWAGPEKEPV